MNDNHSHNVRHGSILRRSITGRLVLSLLLALGMACLPIGCGKRNPESKEVGGEAAVSSQPTSSEPAQTSSSQRDKPLVYTTMYPLAFFAQRIGGDQIEVVCPVPDDADPIYWKPSDEDIRAYQAADLIVTNGAEFEKWLTTVALPASRIIDTAEGFADEFITYEHATTHSHGMSGEHTHEGIDGHTWLDPRNAIRQAGAIDEALSERFPDHADTFLQNMGNLKYDLTHLDEEIARVSFILGDQMVLCSHPAYNYVAQRYNWTIHNLDLDPESAVSAEALREIEELQLDPDASHIMLWESQPIEETVRLLESEYGIASIVFSPCELLSEEAIAAGQDYLSVMYANVERLESALKAQSDGGEDAGG